MTLRGLIALLSICSCCSTASCDQETEIDQLVKQCISECTNRSWDKELIHRWILRIGIYPPRTIVPILISELRSSDLDSEKQDAILRILTGQGRAAVPYLISAFKPETDAKNKIQLLWALGFQDGEEVMKTIATALDDPRVVTNGGYEQPRYRINDSAGLALVSKLGEMKPPYEEWRHMERNEKKKKMAELRERFLGKQP